MITIARLFIIAIVAITYGLAMVAKDANVFDLAIWCFSGFSALFPVVFAALYWKRATKQGGGQHFGGSCQLGLLLPPFGVWRRILRRSGIVPAAICFLFASVALVVVSFMTDPPSKETLKVFPETQLIEKPGFSVLLNTP